MSWRVVYYEDKTGHESVGSEIAEFPKKAQAKILRFIDLLEQEGPIRLGNDYTKHIQDDIWELRIDLGTGRYRVLYFAVTERTVVLLRAFQKKTRKTPPLEIATAVARQMNYEENFRG